MYDAGRREPLPLPVKTSFAWAEARHSHSDPEQAAMYRWRSNRYPGEDQEPAHERAWGKGAGLSDLSTRAWMTTPADYGCRCYERSAP